MPVAARIPRSLRMLPFRGSTAVAADLLTRHQLHGPAWRRLFPDVYILASIEMTHRLWCEAALIYADSRCRAVVSGLSSAHLMGIDLLPIGDPPVTITVPRSVRLGLGPVPGRPVASVHERMVIVRCDLAPADVTDHRLRSTNPVRTAFDLARLLGFREAVAAIDAMAHKRLITIAEMRFYAIGAPRCRGARNIPSILDAADPLAASPMETELRLVLVDGGLPRPESQVEVRSADGVFIGRVDLAYRKARIGIEYEGDHHRDRATFRRDIRRYNAMREAGWTIIRVTADDLRDPRELCRQIRSALDAANM